MSELPGTWVKTTVGELFKAVGGGTPSTAVPEFWQGTIPWISSADIDNNHHLSVSRFITEAAVRSSATTLVPAGTVIVVTRVGLGKVAITDVPLCFSQDHQALLVNEDFFDPRYVLWYMTTAVRDFKHIGRGTTISGVTKKQFLATDFILPPRTEQSRIVAEIEKQFTRLDAATAALKRVQANLKRYRASVLKAACEGRLVPTEAELARKEGRDYEPADQLLQRILRERRARWEADTLAKMIASGKPPKDDRWTKAYREPSAPDMNSLPALPEGWTWATAEVLAEIIDPQPSHRTPPAVDEGVPYVGMGDVTDEGQIDRINARKVSPAVLEEHRKRYQLQSGDFFIGKIGTIGNPVRIKEPFDFALSANVVLIQPLGCPLLFWYMLTDEFGKLLAEGSRATTQSAFGIQKMRSLPCPVPPIEEQNRIVSALQAELSRMDHLLAAVTKNQVRSALIRSSLLKHAFEGKLVPHHPDDEPASKLLERICAERTSKQPRRRKSEEPVHV